LVAFIEVKRADVNFAFAPARLVAIAFSEEQYFDPPVWSHLG